MKLIGISLLIFTIALTSACQKKDDGGGSGNGAASPATPSPLPNPNNPIPASDPYDNRSGPFLNNTDTYQVISGREFTIYNTDGMSNIGCNGNPQMLCLQGAAPRPFKEFTVMASPEYLACINNYAPIPRIEQLNIRSLCQQDNLKWYRTYKSKKAAASLSNFKNESCLARFKDDTTVRLNFFFDDRGILNFAARVGIDKNDYLYRATGIGYQYNAKTNSLIIGSFMASGNNPNMRFLAVNSLSGLRNPLKPIYNNMVLKEAQEASRTDGNISPVVSGAFQFVESILFRFTNYDSSQFTYQQFASGMRFSPCQPGMNGNFVNNGFTNGNPNGNYLPRDPRLSNVDPRFSNQNLNSQTKFLVAGGNLILLPVELLDSMGGGLGSPYVPFHDPRN